MDVQTTVDSCDISSRSRVYRSSGSDEGESLGAENAERDLWVCPTS